MSDRQKILDVVLKLPDNTPMEEILRNIEFVAGIQRGREQARNGQGIPAEQARELVRSDLLAGIQAAEEEAERGGVVSADEARALIDRWARQ